MAHGRQSTRVAQSLSFITGTFTGSSKRRTLCAETGGQTSEERDWRPLRFEEECQDGHFFALSCVLHMMYITGAILAQTLKPQLLSFHTSRVVLLTARKSNGVGIIFDDWERRHW